MKIFIIYCVPAQIPYLKKFWFRRYGPKCSQPIRLLDFLINHVSRTNQWNSLIFLHVDTNSHKSWSKNYWMCMARNGWGQSGPRTLKLIKWNYKMNCLHDGSNWGNLKIVSLISGWVWSEMSVTPVRETLKSAEWVYELGWFLCMFPVMQ